MNAEFALSNLAGAENSIGAGKDITKISKETFDKLIAKLEVCPNCGQKLSEDAREELLK